MNKNAKLTNFVSLTGASEAIAKQFLQVSYAGMLFLSIYRNSA